MKISASDGRVFVWRKTTEEWLPCCNACYSQDQQYLNFGMGFNVLQWSRPLITVEGSVTGTKYRQILQKNLLPLIAERRREGLSAILQDDNVQVHRANVLTS